MDFVPGLCFHFLPYVKWSSLSLTVSPHTSRLQGVEGFSYVYYEDLSPADIVSILDKLKKGEKPKVGDA